jgi:uncharacterized repeat protein (TIGR03843 family)
MTLYQRFDGHLIASGPHDVAPGDDGAEDFVRNAVMGDGWLHPRSSNYTFVVELTDGARHGFGVYKPARGEAPLWDFGAGLYRRECATYELAKLLAWLLVPPTVVRDGEAGVGSLQLFVASGDDSNFFTIRESHRDELLRMAVFDMIANNADRKGGHCFLGPTGGLLGVDHGLTFHAQHKLRTVIWDFAGSPVPDVLLADVSELQRTLCTDGWDRGAALAELIDAGEVEALRKRAEALLANPVMPHPYSRHDVPYPPI